ncbi:MAG: hypothetical protein ACQERG_03520 [Pseudomonadota bacterium]
MKPFHLAAAALVSGLLPLGDALAAGEVNASLGHARVQDVAEGSGPLMGVHAAWDFGSDAVFGRLAGHLHGGNIDRDFDDGTSESDATAETGFRALVGTRLEGGVGLYTGLGYRQFDAEYTSGLGEYFTADVTGTDPRAEYTSSLQTAYVPVGLVGDGRLRSGWEVRTRLEAAIPVTTQEGVEMAAAAGGGTETFNRTGGVGGRLTIQFRRGGLGITPFVRAFDLPQADAETVDGRELAPDDHRSVVAGIRVGLVF